MIFGTFPSRTAAAAVLAAALGAPVLAAQQPEDTVKLNPIVVTATRVPTPLASVSSAITVVTGEELRERGIGTVAEALRDVPGVDVVETGPWGGATSLFVRGGESDYVRVLVDGVPVNTPGGGVDLAALTTADVERIEIVRGPASVLYGSDAVTGVVQVFTRSAADGLRWDAAARGGRASRPARAGWPGCAPGGIRPRAAALRGCPVILARNPPNATAD